jgi:hypothetical protein
MADAHEPLTPISDEPPDPPRAWLSRLGGMLANQAVPLIVGLVSFLIALDAWYSARALEFEQGRALASIRIRSEAIDTGAGGHSTVTTMRIQNVGGLTFAVLDLHVRLRLSGEMTADWSQNSLGNHTATLPIGFPPLQYRTSSDGREATFHFPEDSRTWHVIDPGRSVDVTFVQPTRGSGQMAIELSAYAQPVLLQDIASAITVEQQIRGVSRQTLPESGEGDVSEEPIYPYTASHVLVVP